MVLVEAGQSACQIVIPARPIPSERYAAEELQRYIARITGSSLPIITDVEPAGSGEIVLGATTRSPDTVPVQQGDGCELRCDGERLFIQGARPRGTLSGVYTLLEEEWGVRWFTPEIEVIPQTNRLALATFERTVRPGFESRDVFWREMMRDADFAARHRLNGQHYGLQEKHGGPFTVYHPFVHSFDALVPPALYAEHPEYFPLINGERKGGYVQRCLSNPEVLRIATQKVRHWIRKYPEATIISVSQNDTFNYCQCPGCKALDEAEGSPAASLLNFVNAIAAEIEADHPHVRIDTLAYQYTRKPPRTIRPHRNVIIRLCSIECCFAHPLPNCESKANAKFRDDIEAWQPVAPLLYVWDYTPNFAHYQQPFPNFGALQPNVQFYAKHGVRGLFEQGNYSPGGCGELGPLRAYVLAKLLWNPDTNVDRHIREFTDTCYGAAASKVRAYLDLLNQQVVGTKVHARIYDSPDAAYLNGAFLDQAEKLLDEAVALAEDDSVRSRVELLQLPVWYVQLAQDRLTGESRRQLLDRFLGVAQGAGISHISEARSLSEWAKQMQAE